MESNKKINSNSNRIVLKRKKTQHFSFFLSQSYFKVPKTIRLNATHYFIIKIPNKRELQQIASNHSSDIDFKDFVKLHKDSSDNPLPFTRNLL